MKMSIDENISELKWVRKVNKEILETDAKEIDADSAWIKHWENVVKSLDVAIDTMRKYQKIREIAFPLQFCTTDKLDHEAIMKICEVLEDGNDD